MKHSIGRWSVLVVGIFALILIPFMIFGEQIELWTEAFIATSAPHTAQIAWVLGLLLGGDILLPVPSSLASTAAGFVLGFVRGMLTSWAGMTASCLLGYWLSAKLGRPLAVRLVGERDLERLAALQQRFGDWVILAARPVPMLAEASVMFAGISHVAFGRFMLLTTLSNLGISAVYAAVGAFSSNINSFLLTFFGAILVPGIAMWLLHRTAPAVG